jgi:hypothetical protein
MIRIEPGNGSAFAVGIENFATINIAIKTHSQILNIIPRPIGGIVVGAVRTLAPLVAAELGLRITLVISATYRKTRPRHKVSSYSPASRNGGWCLPSAVNRRCSSRRR